jgi:hypothetical protein
MDRNRADLTFLEIVDGWLRERLSGGQGGILAEMVLHSPGETVILIHKIAENLRRRPTLAAQSVSPLDGHLTAFRQAAADFAGFMDGTAAAEPETVTIVERLAEMATALATAPDPGTPTGLVQLLTSRPTRTFAPSPAPSLLPQEGKWAAAAKQAGLSKADGDRLNDAAETHYAACCDAWTALVQVAAGHALAALIDEAHPILQRYRDHKRASAQLDFDDLIFAARALLRDHDAVRWALGERFAHVLVDEFRTQIPCKPRSSGVCAANRSMAMTTGRGTKSGQARSSWWATPSRRSIASGAPMSAPMSRRATLSAPRTPTASCRSRPISAPAPRSLPSSTSASRPCSRLMDSRVSPLWTHSMTIGAASAWRPSTSP